MLPIKDENPTTGVPVVTILLIILNGLVFIYQLTLSERDEILFVLQFGLEPAWLLGNAPAALPSDWVPRAWTFLTCMFLHGGFYHIAGNMLYLWIFGNNIEDHLGHFRFLAFYLVGGVLASLGHVVTNLSSEAPMIGASGAISAVLGAYLVTFPRAAVTVWVFIRLFTVPAVFVLGIWFFMQVFKMGGPGVAWMAHVGGFVVGIVLVGFFRPRPRRPEWLH